MAEQMTENGTISGTYRLEVSVITFVGKDRNMVSGNRRVKGQRYSNGTTKTWTHRITWYHCRDADQKMVSIKLILEYLGGIKVVVYPKSVEEADVVWAEFIKEFPKLRAKRKPLL